MILSHAEVKGLRALVLPLFAMLRLELIAFGVSLIRIFLYPFKTELW